MRKLLMVALLTTFAGTACAQEATHAQDATKVNRMSVDTMKVFKLDALNWQNEPTLPPGAKSVLLVGDPTTAGMFVVLLKFPPNYKIAPHTHPFAEMITVLSGRFGNGMGKEFDASQGQMLTPGSSFVLPAEHAHYCWTGDEGAIVQLVATGPWGIDYIDPADDPRNKSN